MPYTHSAEIGDLWKHLPLCEILQIEGPSRYFESNAAFAEYKLEITERRKYGVPLAYGKRKEYKLLQTSTFFSILEKIGFESDRIYYGSPALAMTILSGQDTKFYFYDIENDPLKNIRAFSQQLRLQGRVNTECADSINALTSDLYQFTLDDLVFIDPYKPCDQNESGKTFFDVFIRAHKNHAKTVLWYGFESLSERNVITQKLQKITDESQIAIDTFDVWQSSMTASTCVINPGVPGCGIAVSSLSDESIRKLDEYMRLLPEVYQMARFDGVDASLRAEHLKLYLK